MTHIEVRATINHPGVQAGQVVIVDPELPYMKMCLEAGLLVPTGRSFLVSSPAARGAVRPEAPATPVAKPAKAKKARKSRAKKTSPPS